jgi:hypothetical protein
MGNLLSQSAHSLNGEKDLWAACLYQAFRDAVRLPDLEAREEKARNSNRPLDPTVEVELIASREAMAWLTNPSPDLDTVCEMAGVEPECVLERRGELEAGTLKYFNTWKLV